AEPSEVVFRNDTGGAADEPSDRRGRPAPQGTPARDSGRILGGPFPFRAADAGGTRRPPGGRAPEHRGGADLLRTRDRDRRGPDRSRGGHPGRGRPPRRPGPPTPRTRDAPPCTVPTPAAPHPAAGPARRAAAAPQRQAGGHRRPPAPPRPRSPARPTAPGRGHAGCG